MFSTWRNWLNRTLLNARGGAKGTRRTSKRKSRLSLEELESRIVPDSGGAAFIQNNAGIAYQGGVNYLENPLISNIVIYAIYLRDTTTGTEVSAADQTQFSSFFSAYATQGFVPSQLAQYHIPGYTPGNGSYSVSTDDINVNVAPNSTATAFDALGNAVTEPAITDNYIQAVIQTEINAGRTGAPGPNNYYVVFAPPGDAVSIPQDGADSINSFIAYHSNFLDSNNINEDYYAVVPDSISLLKNQSSAPGAGPLYNSNLQSFGLPGFETETVAISHELSEGLVDPTGYEFLTEQNFIDGEEVADLAALEFYSWDGFEVQYLWSQTILDGTHAPAVGTPGDNLFINQITPPAVTNVTTAVPIATFTDLNLSLTAADFSVDVYDSLGNTWGDVTVTGNGDGFYVIDALPPTSADVVGPVGAEFSESGLFVEVSTSPIDLTTVPTSTAPISMRYAPYYVSAGAPLTYNVDSGSGDTTNDSGVNDLVLKVNNGNFQLSDNGLVVFIQPVSETSAVNINADPAMYDDAAQDVNDSLVVDYSGGNFTQNLTFDGGPGSSVHTLTLENGNFVTEIIAPTGIASGVDSLNGQTISFTDLTTDIDLVAATNVLIDGTGNADLINVVNGPDNAGTGNVQTTEVASGNASFPSIEFANKTNVTVNGDGGPDIISSNVTTPTPSLATLTLESGKTPGVQYYVGSTSAGVTTSVIPGGPTVNIDIGSTQVYTDIDEPNGVGITATANSMIVGSSIGFPAVPFVVSIDSEQVLVTNIVGTTWTISRGYNGTAPAAHTGGAYVVYVLGGNLQNILGAVDIDNSSGQQNSVLIDDTSDVVARMITFTSTTVAFNASGLITYNPGTATQLTVDGGSGGNNYFIKSAGITGIVTVINGGAGSDTFTVDPLAIQANVTVNGQNPPYGTSPGNTLLYNGGGVNNPNPIVPGSGTVTQSGYATLNYTGIETFHFGADPTTSIVTQSGVIDEAGGISAVAGTITVGAQVETEISEVGGISSTATQMTVDSSVGFPPAPFVVSVGVEQIDVTNVTGTVWTVLRGYNGTPEIAHANLSVVVYETPSTSAGFPKVPFTIQVDSELMTVVATSNNIWTVVRGADNTNATTHSNGAVITYLPTTTTLASTGGISPGAVIMSVSAASGFPSVPFTAQIDNEIVLVTGINTTTWTIVRGDDGTTAAAHAQGATITVLSPAIFPIDTPITVTFLGRDTSGNPLHTGGLTVAFSTVNPNGGEGNFGTVIDNNNGTYSATFDGTVSGANFITATVTSLPLTTPPADISIIPAPPSLFDSTVTVATTPIPAGVTTTVTLVTRDYNDNPLPTGGYQVGFSLVNSAGAQGTFGGVVDHQNGTYTATFTGTTAGSNSITAFITGVGALTSPPAGITVTLGAYSPSNSTVTLSNSDIGLNGSTLVTLTARDVGDNQLTTGGLAVSFSLVNAGGANGSFSAVTDHLDGTYSAVFTGTVPGSNSITASVNGQQVTSAAPEIDVVGPVDLSKSTIIISPSSVVQFGTATVTLIARDAFGNQEVSGGLAVTFSLGAGAGQGKLSTVTDNGNGTYTATFTGTVVGTNEITGSIAGQPLTSTPGFISVTQAPSGTSIYVGPAYTYAYLSYVYSYEALVNGTGSYATFSDAYYAFIYAYYAYYYNGIGDVTDTKSYAYYAYYYAYAAQLNAYTDFQNQGGSAMGYDSFWAYYYGFFAFSDSYYAAIGD